LLLEFLDSEGVEFIIGKRWKPGNFDAPHLGRFDHPRLRASDASAGNMRRTPSLRNGVSPIAKAMMRIGGVSQRKQEHERGGSHSLP
jgi:hypothetical protein